MYQITYKDIASQEYEHAFRWYFEKSEATAERFVLAVNEKLNKICSNPWQYKSIFKKFHEVTIGKFPYNIVYFIDDENSRIVVVAIYHHKRNPKKKYRR
jgi:plasmid stabilization system protein ParE